jgi:LemA protein
LAGDSVVSEVVEAAASAVSAAAGLEEAVVEQAGKEMAFRMKTASWDNLRERSRIMLMRRRSIVRSLVVVLAVVPLSGCSYNKFVSQEEAIKTQWAQVENQLQRRHDLIPNLVESVKGYASHESAVFQQVSDARARLASATTPQQKIEAANQETTALGRLIAIAENYPQLKANEQFNRLMDELAGAENRIANERMRYNERIQEYNTARRSFPANITAGIFGFKEYPLFDAPPEASQVPKVNFGTDK